LTTFRCPNCNGYGKFIVAQQDDVTLNIVHGEFTSCEVCEGKGTVQR
jgi:DnaJ-class molecular chaperone